MTQKEIARTLSITQATVSMALKGSGRISPAVREAVCRLAAEVGYQPNLAGQMLRRKRANVIGAIFPRLTNLFHAELFQEIQQSLLPHGFMLYLAPAGNSGELHEVIGNLRRMCVSGVIAFAPENLEPLTEVKKSGIAVVLYGGDRRFDVGLSQVLPDRYSASLELMRRLIASGRRHIVSFGAQPSPELRIQAYADAMREAGLTQEYLPLSRTPKRHPMEDAYETMRHYLSSGRNTDAVFAYNDEFALAAKRAIIDSGRTIPRDIALTGFDNIQSGAYLSPSLTTVEQPCSRIAQALITELLATLADPAHENFVSIPCSVIIRESA